MNFYIPKFIIYLYSVGIIAGIVFIDIMNDVDPDRESYILSIIRKLKRKKR